MRRPHKARHRCSFLSCLGRVMCCGLGITVPLVQARAQLAPTATAPAPLPATKDSEANNPAPQAAPLPGPAAQEAAELRTSTGLPDSPGTVLRRRMALAGYAETAEIPFDETPDQVSESAKARASDTVSPKPCSVLPAISAEKPAVASPPAASAPGPAATPVLPCPPAQNPYQRFLNSATAIPLTPRQKGYLAVRNFIDPGNIVTILGTSAIAIASDSHTAYGPGFRGFGRNAGISAVEDATGDFFGTFLIPSIAHEDPHYHRMPNAGIPMRTLHAISRTIIAQGDDGHAIPNYSTLLTYPITAEIANLYVPGIASNGPATAQRVLLGYATDPIDNLITEFLPDVAKRIHVRVIFVQQIINQVAAGQSITMFP